jgi:hypothetical protein
MKLSDYNESIREAKKGSAYINSNLNISFYFPESSSLCHRKEKALA